MSGIQLMLIGSASAGNTFSPSISTLSYNPYSTNIDTIAEVGRVGLGIAYGNDCSLLLESDDTTIRPYSMSGATVYRFNTVSNVTSTSINSSRSRATYSNYSGLWTTQSPDTLYQFSSFYITSPNKTYIGRTTIDGTSYTATGELWVGTETPLDIAVPTSQYAFVFRSNGEIQRLTMNTSYGLDFISTQTWSSTYTTGTRRISFSNTGDKLYVVVNTTIYEHPMSTPYDLTTISASPLRSATTTSNEFQLQKGYYGLSNAGTFAFYQYLLGSKLVPAPSYPSGGTSAFLLGAYVAPNGTDVFLTYNSLVGAVNNRFVQKITLGSSYNPATATAAQQALVSTDGNPLVSTFFKPDGTKAFFLRSADILAFDLGTPWDLSTMSSITGYTFGTSYDPQGLYFSPDGGKLFITSNTFDGVFEFSVATPWDVSTASLTTQIFFSAISTTVAGLSFNTDGSVMYVCTGTGRKVLQFNLTIPFNVSSASHDSTREMGLVGQDTRQISLNADQNQVLFISGSSSGFSGSLNVQAILSAFTI